jgi:Protein of unknown function (DUF3352)
MGRLRFWSLTRRAAPCAVVVALLLAGCGVLPATLGTPTFSAATLVAPDAWSFTDLTLRPSVQQALLVKDVYDFYANGAGGANFGELPTPSGQTVDFEKDVLPHLDGEIAYATSGTVDDPLSVALIHTNDVNAIMRLLADEARPVFTRDARGATRYEGFLFKVAGYKNWVALSNDGPTLEQTLDRINGKGGSNLASQSRYTSVVERLTGDHMGFGYLDITPLLKSDLLKEETQSVDTRTAQGRLAYSLALSSGPAAGLRSLQTQFEYIPDAPLPQSTAQKGDSLEAMDRLPVGNALAVAGPSIGQVAESLRAAASDDVPDDVFTFLQALAGPYGFGVSPAPGAMSFESGDNFPASIFFLGKLAPDADGDAVQDMTSSILDEDVGDPDTYQQQVVVDSPWVAVNVVPNSIGLDSIPQDELASDRMYQWIRPGFAQDGTNVYVNLKSLLAWGQAQGASREELAALNPLQAMGASWRTASDGAGHGHMQVMISIN